MQLIGCEGDSFARWCSEKSGSPYIRRTSAVGPVAHYLLMSKNRFVPALDWNKGVGGEATWQIKARLGIWGVGMPADMEVIFLSGGTNNIPLRLAAGQAPNTIAQEIVLDRLFIRDYFSNLGYTTVDMNIPRRTSWPSGTNVALANECVELANTGLAGLPGRKVDAYAATTGSGKLIDGVHLTQLAAHIIGRQMYDVLTPLYGTGAFVIDADTVASASSGAIITSPPPPLVYSGPVAAGSKAYYEAEFDFPGGADTPTPAYCYARIEANVADKWGEGGTWKPPSDKPQTPTPFPIYEYRDFQSDAGGAHLIARTPVLSGLPSGCTLTGRMVINNAARFRLFKHKIVVI